MLFPHNPRSDDELELSEDDYVMVNPESSQTDSVGWLIGTSFLTGNTGVIPANYIEKCPEIEGWTLHRLGGIFLLYWKDASLNTLDDASHRIKYFLFVSSEPGQQPKYPALMINLLQFLVQEQSSAERSHVERKK